MDDGRRSRIHRYRREIILIVLIKAILLGVAWTLWFSHPVARDMQVDPTRVDAQILGDASRPPQPSAPSQGVAHDPDH